MTNEPTEKNPLSIEVRLEGSTVQLYVRVPGQPDLMLSLSPQTAMGMGTALIHAGQDAMTTPN